MGRRAVGPSEETLSAHRNRKRRHSTTSRMSESDETSGEDRPMKKKKRVKKRVGGRNMEERRGREGGIWRKRTDPE